MRARTRRRLARRCSRCLAAAVSPLSSASSATSASGRAEAVLASSGVDGWLIILVNAAVIRSSCADSGGKWVMPTPSSSPMALPPDHLRFSVRPGDQARRSGRVTTLEVRAEVGRGDIEDLAANQAVRSIAHCLVGELHGRLAQWAAVVPVQPGLVLPEV